MKEDIMQISGKYCRKHSCLAAKAILAMTAAIAMAGCSDNSNDKEIWRLLKECDTYYNVSDTTERWPAALAKLDKLLTGSNDHRALGEYNYQKSCYEVTFTDGDSVPIYLERSRYHYLKTKDNDGICKVFLSSTQYANAIMENDSAMAYISQAMPYMAHNDSMRGQLLSEYIVGHIMKGNMKAAVEEGYSTCRLLEQNRDTLTYLITNGNLGVAYRRLGMTDSAMVCYTRALNLALPFGDNATTAYIYNNLSVLYCETKRFDEALDYAEKALAYANDSEDYNEKYSAIANKASALGGKGEYAEAVRILSGAYKEIAEEGATVVKTKFISYITDYSLKMNRTDSVEYYIREGEKLAESLPQNSTSALGLDVSKINYLIFKKDYGTALKELEELGKITSNTPMPIHKRLEAMADCNAGLGNYSKAYEMTKLAAAKADSIRNEAAENKLAEFTARYETKEKELEIAQLKKEKAIHDVRMARLTGTLIALALGIVIVAIFMLYRRKTERQKKEILRARNYIAGMESERARFARELHDGACNDLLAIGMEINMPDHSKEKIARQIRELRTSLRLISHELMPPSFRVANLNEILEDYLQHLSAPEIKMNCTCIGDGWEQIRKEVAYEMYRIAQETISNMVKHSHASNLEVTLTKTVESLSLVIKCDGQWQANNKPEGIGLRTIRERALSIGGDLQITPSDGNITISISVKDFTEEADSRKQ